ncbi:MAG: TlpA family protein disulfide reductase [Opitutaceae bacterium]|jgi:hypothetical protein|nr:TlpA family protein disulfide reductase [Opitutaceae bacterium]
MTRRILTLALTLSLLPLLLPAQQDEKGSMDAFNALFGKTKAEPTDANLASLRAAGLGFLTGFPKSRSTPQVVNRMLEIAGGMGGKNDGSRRLMWFSTTQYEIVLLLSGQTVDGDAKAALTALDAAMAQGDTREQVAQLQQRGSLNKNSGEVQSMLMEWRKKLDALTDMPAGRRYLRDREAGFYDFVSLVSPNAAAVQLKNLAGSKDPATANWAKTESLYFDLRKEPFDLKFTSLDAKGKGREINFKALQGKVVYLYFWTSDTKDIAADIDRLLDVYFETNPKKFEIIGVCCDPEENRAAALEIIRKKKFKNPQYFDGQGKNGELCKKLNVRNFPAGFIFETTGRLGPINVRSNALKGELGKRLR